MCNSTLIRAQQVIDAGLGTGLGIHLFHDDGAV